MSLLAVDIGSSTCKAVVFATSGEILARQTFSYTPEFPRPSFAEMRPETFWQALCTCCASAVKNLADPVRALCLSSHGETFVAMDAHGAPLTAAILNQDGRATHESAWLEQVLGRERLFQITGTVAHPMYPIAKILWLRKHEPEVYAATNCFVTVVGYLLQRMGCQHYSDFSLASRFLAFDIQKRGWSDEILGALEVDRRRLPIPAPAGTITGHLSTEAASELGVPAGTPVVLGGHDQPCGALGSGITGPGRVSDSVGTYECLLAASDAPSLSKKALAASLNSYCHVVPEKFVTLAYFPSGIMVKWFHDLLYSNGTAAAGRKAALDGETDRYATLEAQAPEAATGLCITPHLIGTCNPEFQPETRAVIAGLGPATDRAHLYKGILEGLACELSIVSEALAGAVGEFHDIYVTGGGTGSALGLKLRAALSGRRLHVMREQEAVCLGSAILAGVAIGEYRNIDEAVGTLVRESAVVTPDAMLASRYREQLSHYKALRAVAVQMGQSGSKEER